MEKNNQAYQYFRKKRKKLFVKTAVLALLFLGINAYAWFIYIDQFSGSIDASVIAWDVTFYDEDTSLERVTLQIDDLYPGMTTYSKEIRVNNDSDIEAVFTHKINSFQIFGRTYTVDGTNLTELSATTLLANELPFSITFNSSKSNLTASGDYLLFTVTVTWPFESSNPYYRLHDYFVYDSTISYYTHNGTDYIEDTTVSLENFDTKIADGLYVESDDADTFWGSQAFTYNENSPDSPSLVLDLDLIVSQSQS